MKGKIIMKFGQLFRGKSVNILKSIKTFLFGAEPKITINHLESSGENILRKKSEVFSSDGSLLAKIEKYTEQCKDIGSNNQVIRNGCIRRRVYYPAENTKLANMGVISVTKNSTLYGTGCTAVVKQSNGKTKTLRSVNQLRNYVNLMKV